MSGMSQRFGQWLRLVVAWSSLATALALVLVWIGNFVLDTTAPDGSAQVVLESLDILGWFELATSVVAILGLAVGVWFHKPLWARGVALVMIGLAIHWGWWILDRTVDVFGLGMLDPSDPQIVQRVSIRFWLTFALDLVAVPLLVAGGVALLRHPMPDLESFEPDFPDDEPPAPNPVAPIAQRLVESDPADLGEETDTETTAQRFVRWAEPERDIDSTPTRAQSGQPE